jgi:uncharacterized membrane protein YgcG
MMQSSAQALRLAGIISIVVLLAPACASLAAGAHPRAETATVVLFDALVAQAMPTAPAVTIPAYASYVTDAAGVIGRPKRASLESLLDQLQKKTGVQFAVLTVRTTAPLTPSEYKGQVFQRWKLGESGKDNGLLMLVTLEEREVRFEIGYGLEGSLPDGLQSRIFREVMRPHFVRNDYEGGIVAGVLEVAERVAAERGVTLEWAGSSPPYTQPHGRSGGPIPSVVFALVSFIIVIIVAFAVMRRKSGSRPAPVETFSLSDDEEAVDPGLTGRLQTVAIKENGMASYKMIQIPPNVVVSAKKMLGRAPDPSTAAAEYLESIVNQHAKEGWEFISIDTIGVRTEPGCLAGILGAKSVDANYYVVTFRR